jgi:hypothetical protein
LCTRYHHTVDYLAQMMMITTWTQTRMTESSINKKRGYQGCLR